MRSVRSRFKRSSSCELLGKLYARNLSVLGNSATEVRYHRRVAELRLTLLHRFLRDLFRVHDHSDVHECYSVPSGKTPCTGSGTRGGQCNGSSPDCTYPPNTIPCSGTTCSAGSLSTQYCNGSLLCNRVVPGSCSGFPCLNNSACASACTTNSTTGCLSGYKCVGGNACVASTVACDFGGSVSCTTAGGGMLRRHLLKWVCGRSRHVLCGADRLQQPDRLPKWQILLLPRNRSQ